MGLQTNNEQESLYLKEALSAVNIQSRLMKQCLVKYSNNKNGIINIKTVILTQKVYIG